MQGFQRIHSVKGFTEKERMVISMFIMVEIKDTEYI